MSDIIDDDLLALALEMQEREIFIRLRALGLRYHMRGTNGL